MRTRIRVLEPIQLLAPACARRGGGYECATVDPRRLLDLRWTPVGKDDTYVAVDV